MLFGNATSGLAQPMHECSLLATPRTEMLVLLSAVCTAARCCPGSGYATGLNKITLMQCSRIRVITQKTLHFLHNLCTVGNNIDQYIGGYMHYQG